MRCYILTDEIDVHGPPFPIGTPAYDDPETALNAARKSGARYIVMYRGKPVENGKTTVELEQGRVNQVCMTRWTGTITDNKGTRLRDWRQNPPPKR